VAFLGQKIDPVSVGLSVASLAATYVIPVVGLALTALKVVYSFVTGNRKKRKAIREARRQLALAFNQIGTELIRQTYGMQIPEWSTELYGNYHKLGQLFYYWRKNPENETNRKELVTYLKNWGIEPSRIMGGEFVKDNEMLNYEEEYVCGPEKYLTGKEALIDLGYTEEQLAHLPYDFFVRAFDIINNIRLAITEEQALLIKRDLENHLKSGGLDPLVVFKTVEPMIEAEKKVQEWRQVSESMTYPEVIKELEKRGGIISIPQISETQQIKTGITEPLKASLPAILIIGLVLGMLFFKGGKE
jgi:hypothetical protein